jgi:hypothetical protein
LKNDPYGEIIEMKMSYRKDVWFSPRKILLRYAQLEQRVGEEIKTASQYKTIREARAVAIMLLGIQKIQNREYWLQLVDPAEGTPDIRTATLVETDNRLAYQDVEVVTLELHTQEDVDDFLKRTKLSAEKAYQDSTIILCNIDKNVATKAWQKISSALSGTNKKYEVYLLGRTAPAEMKYQLARIYPKLDGVVSFDAMEEAKKKVRDTMRFIRGTKRQEGREENEKHEPF